jgi:hypothetical protein
MLRPLCALVAVTALAGCAASMPPRAAASAPQEAAPAEEPPQRDPTPGSVTIANPGGDAPDPELAALERLDREPWGHKRDRWATILVPLADTRNWRRVKLWGYPTRTAFRFGDDHYGITAVWYQPSEGPSDPESCLRRFARAAQAQAESLGAQLLDARIVRGMQHTGLYDRPMVVEVFEGSVDALFETRGYMGAIAAYQSFPGTCLLQGFVVVAEKHRDLARRIRDRWVAEGAPTLAWHPRIVEPPTFDAR